ncbi:PIN domain-containing protein [Streptomyces sp. SP18ES09]|uniref:PIN domain-containing protein n=1 Tax=Streptomyces sp. SP18ES09 TaxID=3002532 RepID=UPI002E766665|nr:PIN domain-containing protein [Streptomyces sp. SP18ES09]MEE1817877.1 PIN domain-containing protein [Streptomyces sp. SP18ES09]
MTSRANRPVQVLVLDSEALSLAVRGDRAMMVRLAMAVRGDAEVVTSPLTLVEAYDGRMTEQRWDWVLSRVRVADVGKEEARRARRLLADTGLHGHKYAIDAVLAVVAMQQSGEVVVLTSDPDDLEKLVPDRILVLKV